MKIYIIEFGSLKTIGIKLAKALGHTVYEISSFDNKELIN